MRWQQCGFEKLTKTQNLLLHLPAKHLEQRFIVLLDLGQK